MSIQRLFTPRTKPWGDLSSAAQTTHVLPTAGKVARRRGLRSALSSPRRSWPELVGCYGLGGLAVILGALGMIGLAQ